MRLCSCLALAVSLFAVTARAETPFAPIPADAQSGQAAGLELRIVHYDGHTNGVIEVDVRNPTDHKIDFTARGMFFVPNGSADSAPQRVGAVGPFQAQTQSGWEQRDRLTLEARSTARLKIDVYCIDSHRSSPSPSTQFHVARERVPKAVADAIESDAKEATEGHGGMAAPGAKSAVQGQVWKNRDKKWIKLEGEGRQEATKSR